MVAAKLLLPQIPSFLHFIILQFVKKKRFLNTFLPHPTGCQGDVFFASVGIVFLPFCWGGIPLSHTMLAIPWAICKHYLTPLAHQSGRKAESSKCWTGIVPSVTRLLAPNGVSNAWRPGCSAISAVNATLGKASASEVGDDTSSDISINVLLEQRPQSLLLPMLSNVDIPNSLDLMIFLTWLFY